TLVNRNAYDVAGPQIAVPHKPGTRYYDLWHGEELTPDVDRAGASLSFEIEAHGYGALLAIEGHVQPDQLTPFLSEMKDLARQPLRQFSAKWRFLPQRIVEILPM